MSEVSSLASVCTNRIPCIHRPFICPTFKLHTVGDFNRLAVLLGILIVRLLRRGSKLIRWRMILKYILKG